MAVGSQCWAIAYFIGPLLGGWALDQKETLADIFWLFVAASTLIGLLILSIFDTMTSMYSIRFNHWSLSLLKLDIVF